VQRHAWSLGLEVIYNIQCRYVKIVTFVNIYNLIKKVTSCTEIFFYFFLFWYLKSILIFIHVYVFFSQYNINVICFIRLLLCLVVSYNILESIRNFTGSMARTTFGGPPSFICISKPLWIESTVCSYLLYLCRSIMYRKMQNNMKMIYFRSVNKNL
jgi:hypothetical protein